MNENYKPMFWAIVEIFGHQIIAGEVGEQTIGNETFIRVDVPALNDENFDVEGFTKLYGKGAIYSITPTDEETCLRAVAGLQPKPIELWKLHLPQLTGPEDEPNF